MMGATLLVVADDRHERYLMRALLELEGYTVVEARNGREALALISASPPSLVITDNFMPELDGYGLVRALREGLTGGDLPIILVSAADEDRAFLAGVPRGKNLFVQKPFTAEALLEAARSGISHGGGSASDVSPADGCRMAAWRRAPAAR